MSSDYGSIAGEIADERAGAGARFLAWLNEYTRGEAEPGRIAQDEMRAAFMAAARAERRRITELAVESRATCIAQGGVEIPFADLIEEGET